MDLTIIPIDFILKAAKSVKKLAYLIAVTAAITSFGTQVGLLEDWGIERAFAIGIASTVDLLAICAAVALQVPGLPKGDRKLVGSIMTFGLAVSITANIIAGLATSVGAAAGHAWPVIAYMLAELIVNRLRNFVARILAAQAAEKAKAEAKKEEPIHATATVQTAQLAPVIATVQPPAIIQQPAKQGSAKAKILALAASVPTPTVDEIAAHAGVKPGWVKHVIKTSV